jgi:hypothetical protein
MPDDRLYWLTNLLLAKELARVNGLKQSAAVKRCAKRMRDGTKSQSLYQLSKFILKAHDHKILSMVDNLLDDLKQEGVIHVG